MQVVTMEEDDIEQVRLIEQASFQKTWAPEAFTTELRHNQAAHYLVMRGPQERVVGYTGAWLVADEAHITSIAIDPNRRGQGLGKLLLLRLLQYCGQRQAHWVTLEVRADNRAALALYRRFGFARVALRKAYYEQKYDAVVMWAGNLLSESYQERLAAIEKTLA